MSLKNQRGVEKLMKGTENKRKWTTSAYLKASASLTVPNPAPILDDSFRILWRFVGGFNDDYVVYRHDVPITLWCRCSSYSSSSYLLLLGRFITKENKCSMETKEATFISSAIRYSVEGERNELIDNLINLQIWNSKFNSDSPQLEVIQFLVYS